MNLAASPYRPPVARLFYWAAARILPALKRAKAEASGIDPLTGVSEEHETPSARGLAGQCGEDANLNAIVRLNCFADNSSFLIEKKGLKEIEASFDSFLKD